MLLGLFLLGAAIPGTVPEARGSEPPLFLDIPEPANNSLLRYGNVIVSGRTVPGANVTVNGEPAFNDNGLFIKALSFREGPGAIHIQVVRGNDSLVRVLNLTVDMTAPGLDIIEPLGPTVWKTGAVLRWRALSEPGANVTLNGIPMTYEGNGVYTGELMRTADLDKVTVKAMDAAGNTRARSMSIPPPHRSVPEPSLLDRFQPWMFPTLLVGIFLIVGGLILRSKRR
jgi:hypothetical protein